MRNPAGFFLFTFHAIASFVSFAGVMVAGMALILPEADWERFWRGAVLFAVSSLIAKFAGDALE